MRNTAKLIFTAASTGLVQAWWPFGSSTVVETDPEPTVYENEEIEAPDVIDVEPIAEMTRETVQTVQKTITGSKSSTPEMCIIENKSSSNLSHNDIMEIFSGINTCEYKKSISRDQVHALENQILGVGGQLNKISVKEVGPGSNGVFATGDIKEGETVMFIPREMMITLEEAEHSPTFGKLAKRGVLQKLELPQSDLMFKLFLMEERRNTESKWASYLETMPYDWSQFTSLYSDEELLMLDGSFFLRNVVEFKKAMNREYETIVRKIKSFSDFSYEEFIETFLLINSRAMSINIHSESVRIQALVPYADLVNHSLDNNVDWDYSEASEMLGFVMTATKDIAQGEELLVQYGQDKSNEQLLRSYGFIDPAHKWSGDNIKMMLKLSEDDMYVDVKKEVLSESQVVFKKLKKNEARTQWKQCRSPQDCTFKFSAKNVMPTWEELSVLRIALYDDTDNPEKLNEFKETFGKTTGRITAISVKNELTVLQELIHMCREKLNDYSRTLAGDEALLERSDLTTNQRHILEVTLNEKKALHTMIELYGEIINWLLLDLKIGKKVMRRALARKEVIPSMHPYMLHELLPMLDEIK